MGLCGRWRGRQDGPVISLPRPEVLKWYGSLVVISADCRLAMGGAQVQNMSGELCGDERLEVREVTSFGRTYAVHQTCRKPGKGFIFGTCLFHQCLPITTLHCMAKESSSVNVKGRCLRCDLLAVVVGISERVRYAM
ncbi:hypothetical protein PAXRUDRAFT_744193 [Paxillus rubicundulus Ve08.2h10]|uniref:Uncharacterized protein n=1 Tax=Paxillus rubicundulus Ve08.2h10 TaxID=930991 RepID=A0A0D0E226_9AGAM|nr:hypothetical protein PAXRUDRAFT_744193 [Paxillus rubicundulus Ve08.2h10]